MKIRGFIASRVFPVYENMGMIRGRVLMLLIPNSNFESSHDNWKHTVQGLRG